MSVFRSLVCVWVVAVIVLVGVEFALAAPAGTPAPTATASAPDESLAFDQRLESIQDAKTCITNAKTKLDVQNCQKAMRIDPKRKIEVHGY